VLSVHAPDEREEHAHVIRSLELSGHLDRALEFLPDPEAIDERKRSRAGLTRPELAVLLAYGKMALYSRLIDSDVPEDPYLSRELDRYFPPQLARRYGRLLNRHRLRREIIATATTNSLVNRMGPAFARRAQEDTGAEAATVARAYTIARESLDARDLWQAIENLDNQIAATVQYEMLRETTDLLQFCTYWLIRRRPGALDIEEQVSRLRPGLRELTQALPGVLAGLDRTRHAEVLERYRAAGVPERLSASMAAVSTLYAGPDLVELAAQVKGSIAEVARAYFVLGAALSLDWLRQEVSKLDIQGHWQAVAQSSLRDDLFSLQRTICVQALSTRGARGENAIGKWLEEHSTPVTYAQQTINEMRKLPSRDFATLSVALQSVRRLTD
jgi:glutamate dehydrogenase